MKKRTVIILSVVFLLSLALLLLVKIKENKDKEQYLNYQENNETEKIIDSGEKPDNEEQVFCTQDVMKCPDGSYVGREPPDCKFKKCPATKFEIK